MEIEKKNYQAFPKYNPLNNEIYFKCVRKNDPTYDHIIGGQGAYIDIEKMVIVQPHLENRETDITIYSKIGGFSIHKPFVFGQKEL